MPQISKYPLDKNIEHEIFQKFWHSLSSLRDADTVSDFFCDFLTGTEKVMLVKRFTIAVLLLRGRSQRDIKTLLHVSNTATGSVSAWLKNAKPKTIKTLERVIRESKWESFFDKVDVLIDVLPPRYGSNWQKAGKEKWQRKLERAAREEIR